LKEVICKVRGIFYHEGKYFNALKGNWFEVQMDGAGYDISAAEFFSQFIEDDTLLSILSGMGLKESEFSLIASACMWDVLAEVGLWYPADGLSEMVRSLFSKVENKVKLRHAIEKISFEDGNYVLSTSKGIFKAKRIILNADVKKTYYLMDDELSKTFKPFIDKREEGDSLLTFYAGIDESKINKERIRAHHVLYYPYLDESNDQRGNRFFENEVEVTFLSDYGKFCPEDKAAVMIRSPLDYDECKFDTEEKYYKFKEKISTELLEIVEPLVPGIGSAVEVRDASTPVTYEVWGGRYRGSIAGWNWDDSMPRCLVKTPLENFYVCGIYSFSIPFLGAFPTSLYSGKLAAGFVRSREKI
jgi:phytoene dehydrogenase-like protein